MFFPKTTRNDLRKSILITLITLCGFFLPSFFGEGGVFSRTAIGIATFIFLFLYASVTMYTMTYKTKDSVAEVIRLPLKTVALLAVIGIASWMAFNILNFNRIGSHIGIVASSSLIEFVFIYWSTFDLGVLTSYFFRRRQFSLPNE